MMSSCRLRQLNPNILITQPTFGYPQVDAENYVINASWDSNGVSQNLANSVQLMVYEPVGYPNSNKQHLHIFLSMLYCFRQRML